MSRYNDIATKEVNLIQARATVSRHESVLGQKEQAQQEAQEA